MNLFNRFLAFKLFDDTNVTDDDCKLAFVSGKDTKFDHTKPTLKRLLSKVSSTLSLLWSTAATYNKEKEAFYAKFKCLSKNGKKKTQLSS